MSTETQEMLKEQRLRDQIIDHFCVGLAFIPEPFQTKTAQNSHALWPHTPTQLTSEPSKYFSCWKLTLPYIGFFFFFKTKGYENKK